MPTDSLEVVMVIMEVDMEVDEEANNGMDKKLDMEKLSGHKKVISRVIKGHKRLSSKKGYLAIKVILSLKVI